MATSHLARIAYVSTTHRELSRTELDTLLSTWRRRNAQSGVTGFVLYRCASVFQLLEGFPDVISSLYESIARDPRHVVAKRIDEPIAERSFGDWSMGVSYIAGHALVAPVPAAHTAHAAHPAYPALAALPALRSLVDPAFRYGDCDEAMGRMIVTVFTTGAWRRSIR